MKNALEWITKEERRGRTWCDVSSLGGASAVLIAYPSDLPEEAPELAGLFVGAEGAQSDPDGARFEACASRVTNTLKGQSESSRNADLRVFVLTKPDNFRTKVLHSSRLYRSTLARQRRRMARALSQLATSNDSSIRPKER